MKACCDPVIDDVHLLRWANANEFEQVLSRGFGDADDRLSGTNRCVLLRRMDPAARALNAALVGKVVNRYHGREAGPEVGSPG